MSAHAHVAVGPRQCPKPDVKSFTSRKIDIPPTIDSLKMKLLDWIQELLNYIGQNAPMEGMQPLTYLIENADGLDTIIHAPTSLQIGPRAVYADFVWGRRTDGHWFIRHIKFGLHLGQAQLKEAERRALKDRLLDKAEVENAKHFHARQTVFPAEQYIHSWQDEIRQGNIHLKALIEEIYELAKEEAGMPENWVSPLDMGLSFLGDGANLAARSVKTTEKMAEVYEAAGKQALSRGQKFVREGKGAVAWGMKQTPADLHSAADGVGIMSAGEDMIQSSQAYARRAEGIRDGVERAAKMEKVWHREHQAHVLYEAGEATSEHFEDEEEENKLNKKSWGDVAVETGVDLISFIPGVGGLTKMFAGMFTEIGLANYAGIVAKIRARIYSCFVGGFITGITLVGDEPSLKHKRDREYYELGVKRGLKLPGRVSFQYQIALMYYAMTHYTSGLWGGTTPGLHGRQTTEWNYPDDWEAKWSPVLLGQSFVTMLGFKHYLIE